MTWVRPTWLRHLTLAHYLVAPERLQALLPAGLQLETRRLPNGRVTGYVSVVLLEDALLALPGPLPRFGPYVQFNLRTYVSQDGRRGVYFLCSHVSSPVAAHLVWNWLGVPFDAAPLRLSISLASARTLGGPSRLPPLPPPSPGLAGAAGTGTAATSQQYLAFEGRPARSLRRAISSELLLAGVPTQSPPVPVPGFSSLAETIDALGHPQWGFFDRNGHTYAYSVYHPPFVPWTWTNVTARVKALEQLQLVGPQPPQEANQDPQGDREKVTTTDLVGLGQPVSVFYVPELYFVIQLPPRRI
ncbi:MAG: DUF2071 domain-containing protein [Limnochordaceae bacterium]|nr:DUF2071 domain-containing protein [Limnochordaceae bacterium]